MSQTQRTSTEIAEEFDQLAGEIRTRHREIPPARKTSANSPDRLMWHYDVTRGALALSVEAAAAGEMVKAVEHLEMVRAAAWNAQRKAVELARSNGATWGEIGAALHISKQAAQQRFALEPIEP